MMLSWYFCHIAHPLSRVSLIFGLVPGKNFSASLAACMKDLLIKQLFM